MPPAASVPTMSTNLLDSAVDALAATFRPDFLRGKVMLVTGGTSGIGAAIAAAAAAVGAAVTATGATEAEVSAAADQFRMKHVTVRRLDLRESDAVTAFFDGLDRLDILVNCAGIIRRSAELDPATFADVVDVNLNGTMRACAAARPRLAEARGAIVNTASMLSFFGGALVPGYAASKGGIAQLTKSLALAYAADGIRVNAIAPGWINTPLTAEVRADAARYVAIAERTALKRWGQPEELVGAVFFLCSPAAGYITGAILPVDGGYLAA